MIYILSDNEKCFCAAPPRWLVGDRYDKSDKGWNEEVLRVLRRLALKAHEEW